MVLAPQRWEGYHPEAEKAMRARLASIILISLVSTHCGGSGGEVRSVELTTDEWAPTPATSDVPYSPAEPLDPRRITMTPAQHLDQERICDLSFVGRLRIVGQRELLRYSVAVSRRTSVRCRTDSGEGWADLVFPKDSAGLATFVEHGERIRVRVLAAQGFEDHPVVAFVANIGEVVVPPPRWEFQPVRAGDPLDSDWEGTQACAVLHQGVIEPVEDGPYPNGVSHHAIVTCRHARGETLIDLAYPEEKQLAALRVRRSEVIPLTFHPERGTASLRIGVYAGP